MAGPAGAAALIGAAALSGYGEKSPSIKKGSTLSPGQQSVEDMLAPFLAGLVGEGLEAWGPTSPLGEGEDYWWIQGPTSTQAGAAAEQLYRDFYSTPRDFEVAGPLSEAIRGMSNEEIEGWYKENIMPARRRIFQEEALPTIAEQYVGPGLWMSSSRQEGISKEATRFAEQTSEEMAQYMMMEKQARRDFLPKALEMEGILSKAPLERADIANRYAAMERQLRLQETQARMQEWMRTRPEYSPILQLALQYLGTQTQFGYGVPGQPSLFDTAAYSIAGSAGDIAGAGLALL